MREAGKQRRLAKHVPVQPVVDRWASSEMPPVDDREYTDDDAPGTASTVVAKPAPSEPAALPPPWQSRVTLCEPDWYTVAPPRRDWLLRDGRTSTFEGVLPRGKSGLLIAAGGLGKTTAGVQLLTAVATGTPWLGTYQVPAPGRVLGVFPEEDLEELRRKSFYAARSGRIAVSDPSMITMLPLAGVTCAMIESSERGNPVDAPFLQWLREWLKAEVSRRGPYTLLMLDPLSRLSGMEAETDNAAATRLIQAGESLIEPSGGANILWAHHTNKMARADGASVSGASARGSSAIYDGVRWAAALSSEHVQHGDPELDARLGELVTLAIVKSNYSRKGEPLMLRRDLDNGGALLPLDGFDLSSITEARASSDPSANRRAQRDEQGRQRMSVMASTILDVLAKNPSGVTYRTLRASVGAILGGCGDPGLQAAIASLGEALTTRPGPRGSVIHCLSGAAT